LQGHGISAAIEQDRTLLDQNIVGQRYDNDVQLKIPGSKFKEALQILIDACKVDLDEVPADYMLLSFTTLELQDVIQKPDEWGVYNYNVALALLQQRGEEIAAPDLGAVLEARNAALSEPRELSSVWFLFGYAFSLIGILARALGNSKVIWTLYGFYGIPGIMGSILGLYILLTKRTLPDGIRMHSFSKKARNHGLLMFALSLAAWLLVILMGLAWGAPNENGI
jgi:hypothetical protein